MMSTTEAVAPLWDFVGHYVGRFSVAPDFGALGQYEFIGEALLPIAQMIVDTAAIKPGEAVLDVGARNNAALLAAQAGAKVTAIEVSPRLLDVAREKLKDFPDTRFELADVAKLPFPDASFDAVIDAVSLMFGADREAAVAEMARVLKPGGRIVWTGWFGGDAISDVAKIQINDTAAVVGQAPFPYSYWGNEDEMRALFGAQGFDVVLTKHPMVNTGPAPRTFLEGLDQVHPVSRGCSLALEKAGLFERTMTRMVEAIERRNEDSEGTKISRHYVVGVATRKA
ncbi:class I SAM-dependent methyltransferase [Rhizorhabdus wittichii]|uniref:class I SAM-dependent methyltransferase n=1 Tax=Rhizorhabdus wittichii TaxID=160791 RepID=UPI00035DB9AD|nr:class I SAM-dependent methyltransferase [Rhizorhabdus wittichii]